MADEQVSDEFFCYHICRAASKLGIQIQEMSLPPTAQMAWLDTGSGTRIICDIKPTKKEALVEACKTLQKYLNVNPNGH